MDDVIGRTLSSWIPFEWWNGVLLFCGGVMGLFSCWFPGKRPVRRLFSIVLCPVCLAVVMICGRFLSLLTDPTSAFFVPLTASARSLEWEARTAWELGPGLHFAVLGFVLVLIFVLLLILGKASLPVSISKPPIPDAHHQEQWKWVMLYIVFSMWCLFLADMVVGLPLGGLYLLMRHYYSGPLVSWIFLLQGPLFGAAIAGAAAWAVGTNRWSLLRGFLRIPRVKYLGLGIAIPIGVWVLIPLLCYSFDRISWANFGGYEPLSVDTYFGIPRGDLFRFYLPAAFFEEIVWRGYLQPFFVRRYGVVRGLIVLSLAWGSTHFQSQLGAGDTDGTLIFKMLSRLGTCLVIGFVLGWLTLRTGSILPAVLAHGLDNVLRVSSVDRHAPLVPLLSILLWGWLAWVLFHSRQIQDEVAEESLNSSA
ncbi:MAG TPA: CPBP family intramembrane glutamic endopeptidase [Candidatus Acidoferrales bacterium]|nr:CPBP family intramembrane glutamic endopeptidase [Candidatus Acidoferrales bacterium]